MSLHVSRGGLDAALRALSASDGLTPAETRSLRDEIEAAFSVLLGSDTCLMSAPDDPRALRVRVGTHEITLRPRGGPNAPLESPRGLLVFGRTAPPHAERAPEARGHALGTAAGT